MELNHTIDDVIAVLRRAKEHERKSTLLIGAGCSVKAGIPTAGEFVKIIRKEYRRDYDRAPEKTYPHCMAELHYGERRELIAKYVDKAKVNWAHIGIACMMKAGYVDRIFTTNFDPLIIRACALINIFPAVYDFAASQEYNAAYIPENAVFYLHGQRSGFVLLNTKEEVNKLSKSLEPVFRDAGLRRTWVVVGYSGSNDPVFEQLAKTTRFDYSLYWVCNKDSEPAEHVYKELLTQDKYAFYVQGYDADDFFAVLAQKLGCFPPDLIKAPFSYLDTIFNALPPYTLPTQKTESDVTSEAREMIRECMVKYEEETEDIDRPEEISKVIKNAKSLMMAGDYDKVIALGERFKVALPEMLADLIGWAYVMQGNTLSDQAKLKTGEEADLLFSQAVEKYEAALKIKPDMHDALYNWGLALSDQAEQKTGEEADLLFSQAGEKYEAALKIKPDKHEAINNWGLALGDQAKQNTGEEADRLFSQAGEKYDAALKIKPDKHEALYNWGLALSDQAEQKTGEEADRLFSQAGEKYDAALKIKPDMHEALYNWGNTLSHQAGQNTGEEADRLFSQASEKYDEALKIKPDMHEGLYNWGNTLSDQAKHKTGEEANRLFSQAVEKYEAALKIKPDMHEALHNWGLALSGQAKHKTGAEADHLFEQVYEKYQAALDIKPDMHEALFNWGNDLSTQAEQKTGAEADHLFEQAYEKYQAALDIKPDMHEALFNWGTNLSDHAKQKTGAEADHLFEQAYEKYQAALDIKPDMHEALNNWGTALGAHAKQKTGAEADHLFEQAYEKYQAALDTKPDKHEALNNWGAALSAHAKQKTGAEADHLFEQAYEKYQAALDIKPDYYEAINNWGTALIDQAKLKEEEKAVKELLGLAKEKSLQAEDIVPGVAAYNLACISALLGNESECRSWLVKSREQGKLPNIDHLNSDEDLDSVRGKKWFKDFLAGF